MVAVNNTSIGPDTSPGSPQPTAYDLNKGWITGIFGCLRPVLSIIGKTAINDVNSQGK